MEENTVQNQEQEPVVEAAPETKTEKTLTQSEVNKLMTAEREKGKRQILKELGITDVASAKEGLSKYQEYLNSQKTDLQKAQDMAAEAVAKQEQAEARAQRAEACVIALSAGANKDSLDDLVLIASSKVTDNKSLDKVIEEMKDNAAYAGFFSAPNPGSIGTGAGFKAKTPTPNNNKFSFGAELAKKTANPLKGSYFTN